ncbi:MAG: ribonuclease Y [Clostridia bacterium]|nr:ribonuclease Y [Clostridia bacterium]
MYNHLSSFFFFSGSADVGLILLFTLLGIIASATITFFVYKKIIDNKIGGVKNHTQNMLDDAIFEAKTIKKEAILEAKEETLRLKTDFEKQTKERRTELQKLETRLQQKEETLDKKEDSLTKKSDQIELQQKQISGQQSELAKRQNELDKSHEKILAELERVASLSKDDAKKELIDTLTGEAKKEAASLVKKIEAEAKETGDKKAKEIITQAIQRCASDQVSETTISTIALPNDDMKGRLIGREGRNIRSLENATGVELIVDDTPEVVILSGFDPVRRQIARITVEKLIADGRIHPARIEEMVEKVKKEIDASIKEDGEAASFDTGVFGLHPELIKLIGRLKYRTSYGQNVLNHSIEVAYLAGLMADELGVDVALAKRGGLLHDIGKAVDHEFEGTHIEIGADLAKKYKESKEVINCIQAHHGDVEPLTVEAVLVAAADSISAARPGARRETLDNYVKRLEKLEEISNSFEGVQRTYAVQAGREIRIIVKPEVINDETTVFLAKDIAKKIESELEYPGQIKVNVIRETRAVEFAK